MNANVKKDGETGRPETDKEELERLKEAEAETEAAAVARAAAATGQKPSTSAPPASGSAGIRRSESWVEETEVVERIDFVQMRPVIRCEPLARRDVAKPKALHDREHVEAVAALASLYQLGWVMRVFPALEAALAQFKSGELRVAECSDEMALYTLGRKGFLVSRAECAALVARYLGATDPALQSGAYVDDVAPRLWSDLLADLRHGGRWHWMRAGILADALAAYWSAKVSDAAVMAIRDLQSQFDAAIRILADLDRVVGDRDYWSSVRRFAGDRGLLTQWRTHAATQEVFAFVVDTAAGQYAEAAAGDGVPEKLAVAATMLSPEVGSLLSSI